MEKFFSELVKRTIGRPLFLLLALVTITLSAYYIEKPNAWMGLVVGLFIVVLLLFFYRHQSESRSVESKEWFKIIVQNLRNASSVCAYLREFDHPDEFANAHRDALLEINKLFIKGMLQYPESFRIVAYNETGQATAKATKWLEDGLAETLGSQAARTRLDNCLRILDRQPSANSSTVYVIDDEILVYNHVKNDGEKSYYVHFLQRSVIPLLLQTGLRDIFETARAK